MLSMDTVYGLITFILLALICYESESQQEKWESVFNSSSFNFLKMAQYRFCGTKIQCDKNLTFHDTESMNIYESFKDVIPFTVPEVFNRYCCRGCSCDLSICQERGTCCSDILTPEIVSSETYSRFTCASAQLRPRESGVQYGDTLWMVRKCSKGFVNDTESAVIKDKCENWTEYPGLDTKVPVTDITSNITYHDRYCLVCNNILINNALVWDARLLCTTANEWALLQNLDGEEILDAITRTKTCNIVYERPEGTTFPLSHCELGIGECNVTGRWAVYDPFTEAACHMFTSLFWHETSFKNYKNVFCYMCNEIVTPETCTQGFEIGDIPLFSSLLKYRADETHKTNTNDIVTSSCTDSQLYDKIQNICRNISCRFPKTLEGGQCVNMVETLAGVSYLMYLKFTPQNVTKGVDSFEFINSLVAVVDDKLTNWGTQKFIYSYTVLYKVQTTENDITVRDMDTNTKRMQPPPPDVTEDNSVTNPALSDEKGNSESENNNAILFSNAVSYILFRIGFYINATTDKINISVLDDTLKIDGEYITAKDITGNVNGHFKASLDDYSDADFTTGKYVNMRDIEDEETLQVFPIPFALVVDRNSLIKPVIIAEKLACPLVHVDIKHDTTIKIVNNTVNFYETRIERKYFYEVAQESVGNDSYYLICADIFLQALNNFESNETNDGPTINQTQTVKRIMSITLVMLSLLCSLLTFVTYCLFKDLRSQPGLNNMCLVGNLIIAQLLFQFGSGRVGRIPDWACQTIGVLVHFFWLEVIFWMNVCTFHMFNVFGNIRKVEDRQRANRLRTTLMYTVYCFLSSALFVVVNIAVVSVSSQNESIGYGGHACYVSRRDMIGYSFALPIFLVIFINLILFGIVVLKISRLPTVDSSIKSNRNYFAIYAKLASITGITWITGMLFYFTDVESFEYIFIILNAGQGVFIFLSFVCNKRVFRLYKTLLIRQKPEEPRNKSNTTRETTFNSSSTNGQSSD